MPIFPSSKHGLGHIPEPIDARDIPFTPIFGVNQLTSGSMTGLVPIFDQRDTSSCVANAIATAIMVRETVAGVPDVVVPSRLQIYSLARYQIRAHRSDAGCHIRDAVKVLHKGGVCDETDYPFSRNSLVVNRIPPAPLLIEGHQRSGGRYVRIDSYGEERIAAIRIALRNHLPVVFGTTVNESFMTRRGSVVVQRPTSKFVGGHAMCVLADDPVRGAFIVQNSWGLGWGDQGYWYMSYDYMMWDETRDIWAIDGWKRLQALA